VATGAKATKPRPITSASACMQRREKYCFWTGYRITLICLCSIANHKGRAAVQAARYGLLWGVFQFHLPPGCVGGSGGGCDLSFVFFS